jgi:hypothetical protein
LSNTLIFPDGTSQNTAYTTAVFSQLNTATTQANTALTQVGAAYTQANSANVLAQAAFNTANSASSNTVITQGVDATQNTNITNATTLAQASFNYANTSIQTTGNQTITGSLNIANTGNQSGSVALSIAAANTKGGTGYADFLKVTNTYPGTETPSKFFRIDTGGSLNILNSGYTASIFNVSDSGLQTIGSASGGVTNYIANTNALQFVSGSDTAQIFSDGNFHISSSTGAIWINPLDSSAVRIGTQYNSGSGGYLIVQGGVQTLTNDPSQSSFFPKTQSGFNVSSPSQSMDNLNVRLRNTSGTQLIIEASAVSGSFNAYTTTIETVAGYAIGSQTNSSGISFSAGTWTSVNAIHTLGSGGDVIIVTVVDTTNNRVYRVTCIHCGATAGGFIAIERMV